MRAWGSTSKRAAKPSPRASNPHLNPRVSTVAKKAAPPKPDHADEKKARQIAGLLKVIGEPTRIRILRLLAAQELNVGELCTALGQNQPEVSRYSLPLLRVGG